MKTYRVTSAVALDDSRVALAWSDGLQGVIDFSELFEQGVFKSLLDPERFRDVRIAEFGDTIYWLDDESSELDICPDVLRAKLDPKVEAWIAEQKREWHAREAAE